LKSQKKKVDTPVDFGKTSVSGLWDELAPARQVKLSPELQRKIRSRQLKAKAAISIRLEPKQIEAAKRVAAAKSIGYQTQLRVWIAEGIRREVGRH
jgi:predicted DNA binding CopG/RHH family protein